MRSRKISCVWFKSSLSGLDETLGNLKFISICLNLISLRNNLSTTCNIYPISFISVMWDYKTYSHYVPWGLWEINDPYMLKAGKPCIYLYCIVLNELFYSPESIHYCCVNGNTYFFHLVTFIIYRRLYSLNKYSLSLYWVPDYFHRSVWTLTEVRQVCL